MKIASLGFDVIAPKRSSNATCTGQAIISPHTQPADKQTEVTRFPTEVACRQRGGKSSQLSDPLWSVVHSLRLSAWLWGLTCNHGDRLSRGEGRRERSDRQFINQILYRVRAGWGRDMGEEEGGGTEERTLSLQRTVRQFESVVEFATLEGKQGKGLRFERHAWTLRGAHYFVREWGGF